jgi:hypothetical protein
MEDEKLVFKTVQDLLESLKDNDCTFLFVSSDNRFVIKGEAKNIISQILFSMCRYPEVELIIKACAENFEEVNKKIGHIARRTEMEHLVRIIEEKRI